MGALAILRELHALMREQIDAVVSGNHQALLTGALRHEELLRDLATAHVDAVPEELRQAAADLEREKAKLQSLLASESLRADYLLRILLGGGPSKPGGYPRSFGQAPGPSMRLNLRT